MVTENCGVHSQGRESDSSYGVSGTSSAGTARDRPRMKATTTTEAERRFFMRAPELDWKSCLGA